MDVLFSKILSMSLSASFVIAAVLLLRILLNQAPKKYSYFLWLLVFFRLLCPVTIDSGFSLIPIKEDAIVYQNSADGGIVRVNTGIERVDQIAAAGMNSLNQAVTGGSSGDSMTPAGEVQTAGEIQEGVLERAFSLMEILWIIGVFVLAAVGILQVWRLKRKLRTAVLVSVRTKDCCPVYESEYIHTAFLLGMFRPRIYLPLGIEDERGYVIAHEMMHKKRLDHLVKPLCYLVVIVHWFNPLVWLSFFLMTKDMEMSCDEQVLKSAIEDIRGEYSRSLLNLSVKGKGSMMPLSFGEVSTKERILHALKYKKPSVWIGAGAIVVLLVAAVTLLPGSNGGGSNGMNGGGSIGDGSGTDESGNEEAQELFFRQLSESRNPYIGDNSANGRLLGILPGLQGYESRGMELQTAKEPYELKLNYVKAEPINVEQEQENLAVMRRNSLYLFATIENMDICTFALEDDGVVSIISYTRTEMEEIFGALYERSETSEGLKALEKELEAYQEKMEELLDSTLDVEETVAEEESENVADQNVADQNVADQDMAGQDMADHIDRIISEAILEYTENRYVDDGEHVEAHVILGGEDYIFEQLIQSDREMVFYILVRDAVYGNIVEEGKELAGSSFPAKVTISIQEDGSYMLKEFWVPRDGSSFEDDIKEQFPKEYWDAAFFMEGYQEQMEEELLQKAVIQLEQKT